MNNFKFQTVRTIINEQGGVSGLARLIAELEYASALIVTDSGIVKAGHLTKIEAGFTAAGIAAAYYPDVGPDPQESMVLAAVEVGRTAGCDCVIGIGGGSVMDVAKAASVLLKTGCSLNDIYGIEQVKGGRCCR